MRKLGLTIDNLLATEVVTAEGDIVRASVHDHPDLFWALRGGGGNFSVVTSFQFALHPVGPDVIAGPVFWAAEDTAKVLRLYRDFVAGARRAGNVVRLGTVPRRAPSRVSLTTPRPTPDERASQHQHRRSVAR